MNLRIWNEHRAAARVARRSPVARETDVIRSHNRDLPEHTMRYDGRRRRQAVQQLTTKNESTNKHRGNTGITWLLSTKNISSCSGSHPPCVHFEFESSARHKQTVLESDRDYKWLLKKTQNKKTGTLFSWPDWKINLCLIFRAYSYNLSV